MAVFVKYLSISEWQQYVDHHPQATFFHTPQWYSIWDNYMGYVPHAVILTVNGKEVFFPYAATRFRKGLFKKITSSPAGVYGGFLSKSELRPEDIELVLARVSQMGQEIYIVDKNNHLGDRQTTTQIIDLSAGIEAVRANYAEAQQRKINKTQEQGVVIRLANTSQDWETYVSIYNQMLNNWANPTMKYSAALFNEMKEKQGIQLWLAELEGEILGGILCLYHNKQVAYWHGASNEEAKKLNANYLLFDTVLADACAEGYTIFDMMPSAGLTGVEEFKTNWGAVKKEVSLFIRSSKILKIFGHA